MSWKLGKLEGLPGVQAEGRSSRSGRASGCGPVADGPHSGLPERGLAGASGAPGFSLVELLIVLLLTAMLAAAGFELAEGIVKRHRLQSGCEIFVSAVERARSLAVARNDTFEIRIHPSRKSFAVAPAGSERPVLWRDLPRGVEFLRKPSRDVAFHSRGAAAPAGSFSLAASDQEIRVVIAVSGRIRWEQPG